MFIVERASAAGADSDNFVTSRVGAVNSGCNTSSTRRSKSTSYVHAVSRIVVDPKGHADYPRTDEWKHPPTCARKCSCARQGKQQRTYPNANSTRSRHLGDAGTSVRSCLRAGDAADRTRSSRTVRGCAGKAHDHWRRNKSRRCQGQPQHRNRGRTGQGSADRAGALQGDRGGPRKQKFKNWDDFVARKVVPADAASAMKDVVSF